jgi:dephospho-CoA kinase
MAWSRGEKRVNVAVTGGLGTGKSTVSKILAATLAARMIDTDQECRRQMEPGAEGFKEFRRIFGEKYLKKDGTVDRELLRQNTFADEQLRTKLEGILHPLVRRQVASCSRLSAEQKKILIVEIHLLYEVGWQADFDVCVVVYIPVKQCVERVMARDRISAEQIRQILDAQIPIEKKLDYGHFIVDNSGTLVSTVQQVAWLAKKLKRKAQRRDFQ